MKKIAILALTICVSHFVAHTQIQPNYSFYNLQQSIVNPAAMGSYDRIYGGAIFNTQLQGYDGAPLNGLLDFGIPIPNTNLNIGGQVMYESIGAHMRANAGVQISYRLRLDPRNYLAFGIMPYAQIAQTDFTQLNVSDPNDPQAGNGSFTSVIPNFKLGAYYFRDNAYVGLSVGNVLTANTQNAQTDIDARFDAIHFYLNGGYQYQFAPLWKFQPSVMLRYNGASPLQVDVNMQFLFHDAFGFGLSYRSISTLIAQVNYTYKDLFRIGYAFNYGFALRNRSNAYNGHEVYVGFMLAKRSGKDKYRVAVDVPRF